MNSHKMLPSNIIMKLGWDGEEPRKETTKKLHMRNHSGIGLLLIFMQKKQIESTYFKRFFQKKLFNFIWYVSVACVAMAPVATAKGNNDGMAAAQVIESFKSTVEQFFWQIF